MEIKLQLVSHLGPVDSGALPGWGGHRVQWRGATPGFDLVLFTLCDTSSNGSRIQDVGYKNNYQHFKIGVDFDKFEAILMEICHLYAVDMP